MPTPKNVILRLEVPFIVRLASRRMPLAELQTIVPGAILELPKQADEDLDVMVNNRVIGTGTAVKVGENFGVRISTIGSKSTRAEATVKSLKQPSGIDDLDAEAMAAAMLGGQV